MVKSTDKFQLMNFYWNTCVYFRLKVLFSSFNISIKHIFKRHHTVNKHKKFSYMHMQLMKALEPWEIFS